MTGVYDYFVFIFLIIFLIGTLLAQFKNSKILNFDYLGLLPSYRFFSPRPVTRDIRVYARGITTNDKYSNWKELFEGDKKWYCFIWNPQHRLNKTIVDIYGDIDFYREAEEIWHLSHPYLILLYATTFLFNSDSKFEKVEFMITCYAGNEEQVHDIIFKSNVHSIR